MASREAPRRGLSGPGRPSRLRQARGWTEYQLAERSGLPQSTISSWYRKGMVPTLPSLEKICRAYGITLSQLLSEGEEPVSLTENQRRLLALWARLGETQQAALLALPEEMQLSPSRPYNAKKPPGLPPCKGRPGGLIFCCLSVSQLSWLRLSIRRMNRKMLMKSR
ncbi:MAG: helix-turn-helix transcriptional regulator [Bacteroidales bacterium]|nr:helix-turn-helix transcriptional regulator [Bacteroidales bacterium]